MNQQLFITEIVDCSKQCIIDMIQDFSYKMEDCAQEMIDQINKGFNTKKK